MRKQNLFNIGISLALGVSICMSSAVVAFAEEQKRTSEEKNISEELVDLSAFYTDGEYCYKGIPWRASKEEAEEILGVSLELDIGKGTEMGNYRSLIEYRGEPGYMELGFLKDGVTFVAFSFGTENKDEKDGYEGDLTELWEYVQGEFIKNYGEPDKITEEELFKSCRWEQKVNNELNTLLLLHYEYDKENHRIYNMGFDVLGVKDLEELRKELGISPNDKAGAD